MQKKIEYLYRKGRIVTITWTHGGDIVKVLARPGQYVFCTLNNEMELLKRGEYIVEENIRIKKPTFLDFVYKVAQQNIKPKSGRLVNIIHLAPATVYEKRLRRKGIFIPPFYESHSGIEYDISPEPKGIIGEIIAFKYNGKLRLVKILKIVNSFPPCFELSNGECIERGSLKLFYRKTNEYEQNVFKEKKSNKDIR